ncbi:MAG: hypothetical protein R3C68_19155 [Myxococcota bacterium]
MCGAIVTEPSFGLGDWHTQVIVQDGLARVRVIDPDGKEAMRRDVALYERSSREVAHTIVLTIAEAFSPLFDDLSSAIVDRQGSGSNLKGAQVVTTTPGLLRWRLGAFAEASSSQPGGATALGGGVDLGIAGVRWVANLSLVLSPPKIDEGNDYRIKLASGRVRLAGGVHYLWGDFDMTADLGVTSRWVEEVRRGEGIVAGQRWYAETSIGPRGGVAWYVTRRLAVGLDLLVDRFFPYHAFVVDGRTVLHTGRLVVHGRLGALMAF